MFNSINLERISSFTNNEISNAVTSLADHINNNLDFKVEQSSLKVLFQQMDNEKPPSLEVLEGFRKLTKVAIEKGLYEKLEGNLTVINNLCQKIIAAHPSGIPNDFSGDVFLETLTNSDPKSIVNMGSVNKSWHAGTQGALIFSVNLNKTPVSEFLNDLTAKEAINWLSKNPASKFLEYANFDLYADFDNECLENLIKICPNLKFLSMMSSGIEGDALKALKGLPNLQTLGISSCQRLDSDSLKYLEYAPKLQNLFTVYNNQLEKDALKNLQHTPLLKNLNIMNCTSLDRNALENLKYTPNLESLNISYCNQLMFNSLKYLEYTPNLNSLELQGCDQLLLGPIPEDLLWLVLPK